MKRIIAFTLLICPFISFGQSTLLPGVQNPAKEYISGVGWSDTDNGLIYLPWDYSQTSSEYPLIIFLSGSGERGDNVSKLLGNGLPKVIDQGNPPYSYDGTDTTKFVVLSPQKPSGVLINAYTINSWVSTLIEHYNLRIDKERIYLTGLSLGGGEILVNVLGQRSAINGWHVKAAVVMSNGQKITPYNVSPLSDKNFWFFQGTTDNVVHNNALDSYNQFKTSYPGQTDRLTMYVGGHCCWNQFYDPTWHEDSTDGKSIYDWMLDFKLEHIHTNPIADAGSDQTLTSGTTSTTLSGSGTAFENASIVSYKWSTSSLASISSPNSSSTTISDLEDGRSYLFTLTVTDDSGSVGQDDVTISVMNGDTFIQPVANAGPDRTVYESKDTVIIHGDASTGSITSWVWSKLSGGGVTMSGVNTNTLVLSNLNKGTYHFNLSVQGDEGWASSDQFFLYVLGTNTPPVADAGSNQGIPNTETIATLDGSNSYDEDGVITDYHWTTTSGANITDPNQAVTTVTGLQPGTSYTFQLTVTDDSSATSSDEVIVSVGSTPPPNDSVDYQIPLDVNTKFWKGDTVFYQFNDPHRHGESATHLIDEQDVTGTPSTIFEKNYQAFDKLYVVIDLGGFYKISSIKLFKYYGTADLYILHGSPFNWSTDTLNTGHGGNSWRTYNTDFYTRYLKVFYSSSGNQKVREMKLFGHLVRDSLSRTPPDIKVPDKTKFTMGQFMGVNQEGPMEVDSVGSMIRHYYHFDWIDTVTTTHNIDSIKFVFSVFGHENKPLEPGNKWTVLFPDTTELFPGHALGGLELHQMIQNGNVGYFDSFVEEPPTYARNQGNDKPIDTVNQPYDPTNPHAYERFSRMMWTYAAYFGSEEHPADSMQTPYPELSGLDIRRYVEGLNEANADWLGRGFYYTPEEFTAIHSAMYDGDVGTMGSRMGIKNADPNMTVVMGGTAGMHMDYLKMIQYFSYYKRKDHSVPFDIVNVHTYPTTGKNGDNDETHAFSPERYFGQGNFRNFIVECSKLMPGKPIWLTEWGYDRNGRSPISVPQFGGLDSAQVQAQWISRWWLMMSFTGIQRSTIFQLKNDPFPGTFGDSLGIYKFNTTGLTDGRYVGDIYSPGFNTQNYYAYPAWYFQRTLWMKLYNYKPDSIIYEDHDSIWVYKYRNAIHPDSVAYVVWSGTERNRIVDSFQLRIGDKNESTSITLLADKKKLGITTTPTSDDDSLINLTISETPRLVFTTDSKNGGELVEGNEPPPNEPPTADAGNDQTLEAGTTSTILSGSGTDSDGNIVSYHWTTTSSTSITSPNSQNTTITGLQDGNSYTFTLVVTDDDGATDEDIVTVTVEDAPKDGFEYKILPYRDGDKILYIKVLTKED